MLTVSKVFTFFFFKNPFIFTKVAFILYTKNLNIVKTTIFGVSHDPSEIFLIYWFGAQETFPIHVESIYPCSIYLYKLSLYLKAVSFFCIVVIFMTSVYIFPNYFLQFPYGDDLLY